MVELEQTGAAAGRVIPTTRWRLWLWCVVAIALCTAGALVVWSEMTVVPSGFPTGEILAIPSGASLREIAATLKEARAIHSETAFVLLVTYYGAESHLIAGDYLFSAALPLPDLTKRLVAGEHGIERLRITIPEGTSLSGMGRLFAKTFKGFDEAQFALSTKGSEGYLFPDTYFFFSTATSGVVIPVLKKTFLDKTAPLEREAFASKKSWSDIIIMASIIEEEAVTPEDRRIVSGILWKRLAKKMRLQVDAPFAYDIGKNSTTLTQDDLEIDSPYNTYLHYGLPPTPITNPGLDAIDAALHPETSPYFFYLSDKAGVIHYAKTFTEHKLNKTRYLR